MTTSRVVIKSSKESKEETRKKNTHFFTAIS